MHTRQSALLVVLVVGVVVVIYYCCVSRLTAGARHLVHLQSVIHCAQGLHPWLLSHTHTHCRTAHTWQPRNSCASRPELGSSKSVSAATHFSERYKGASGCWSAQRQAAARCLRRVSGRGQPDRHGCRADLLHRLLWETHTQLEHVLAVHEACSAHALVATRVHSITDRPPGGRLQHRCGADLQPHGQLSGEGSPQTGRDQPPQSTTCQQLSAMLVASPARVLMCNAAVAAVHPRTREPQ